MQFIVYNSVLHTKSYRVPQKDYNGSQLLLFVFLSELKGKKKERERDGWREKKHKIERGGGGNGGGERWEHRQTDRLGVQRIKCGR